MEPDRASAIRQASVLVPLYTDDDADQRWIVFVQRAPAGMHGGQLALPGGNAEPQDNTPLDTALREASEELGLEPDAITVLETMSTVITRTTGYAVTPYLARIHRPPRWFPDIEVTRVVELPVASLLAPEARQERVMSFPTWPEPRLTSCLVVDEHMVWGLTLRLLEPVLARLAQDNDLGR